MEKKTHRHVVVDSSLSREEMMQLMLLHEQDRVERERGEVNPDKMTYEELLELEEKMGKVSKGLNKYQIKVMRKMNQ